MKQFDTKTRNLLLTIAVTLGVSLLHKAESTIASLFLTDPIPAIFVNEIVFFLLAVIGAAYLKRLWALKPQGKGLGTALLTGWWFLLYPSFTLILSIGTTDGTILDVILPGSHIAMLLVTVVLIGLTEELVFRGILLNGCLDYFGEDTPAGIRKAVAASGIVFGAIHLLNVFSGMSFSNALIQAVSAMATGILFGTIYVRSRKNLWSVAFLHSYLDLLGFVMMGVLAGANPLVPSTDYSPALLVFAGIELLLALFFLRKKKLQALTAAA